MARRNEQEYEGRRQQIIDGALEVFASKGFEQATNREIAAAAGINSPGLLYHYFKDKEELFREVIGQRIPLLQLMAHPEEVNSLPPEELLTRFGRAYLAMMDRPETLSLLKLLFSEAVRRPAVGKVFYEFGPGRALAFLKDYLKRQMEAETLRREDPDILARCFMGPLVAFFLTQAIFGHPDEPRLDREEYLETHVRLFLRGLRPEP